MSLEARRSRVIPARIEAAEEQGARSGFSLQLALFVGAALLVGALIGLHLNRSAPAAPPPDPSPAPALASLEPAAIWPDLPGQPAPAANPAYPGHGAVEALSIAVPANPFEKIAAPAVAPAAVPAEEPTAPAAAKAASARPAKPSAPPVEELLAKLSVTGLVRGEPPLAVVRYQGQSLFLKIGDSVADICRLVEIKERSVLFQLGDQRVEVPIQ
jgi:hypothetical protein